MHTGAFAAAGQRLADTDDSFSSAPRGILIGQIPQILRAKKFDGTRGGQRLDIWLEEIDKAIIVNPDVFRQWKGDATDRSIAEHTRPGEKQGIPATHLMLVSELRISISCPHEASRSEVISAHMRRQKTRLGVMRPQVTC